MKIALIPAYEPGQELIGLLKDLKQYGYTTVIVDDGSSPACDDIFSEAAKDSCVLRYAINQGKGFALKTGFEFISENFPSDSIVVTMDADGQHLPEDADKICREAEQHPRSLVLGSRHFRDGVPFKSKAGNRITSVVFHLCTGVAVSDTQTGLRAFRADQIPKFLAVDGNRYEYEINVLLSCSKNGTEIREVPIQTIYKDNNRGSHFRAVKDSVRIYQEILKFSFSSLAGFLTDYGMFSLLSTLLAGAGAAGLILSNVLARIVSGTVNFTLNRRMVFKSHKNIFYQAAQYAMLAALILIINTSLLTVFVEILGVNRFLAKIVVECILFFFSWLMQKKYVFRDLVNTNRGGVRIEKKRQSYL